ncbi:MAG: MFS transporter [Erysipelotrichaceae bacterium]|nr:MFS transporter [Erysipelotrichaceae bacterium]
MKKDSIIFFIIIFIQNAALNFVHPVTPTLINNLQLPSYTFGVAFASMATSSFLFSRLWGYLSSLKDNRYIYAFGCITYGLSQLLFMISTSVTQIIIARLLGGLSVAAIDVSILNYLVNISSVENKSKNFALFTGLSVIAGSFGYLIGGYVGNNNLRYSFYSQLIVLVICATLLFILGNKKKETKKIDTSKIISYLNPLISFDNSYKSSLKVLLIITFLASSATTIYEQTFNYYLNDILHFMPSRMGEIKAISTVLILLFNLLFSYKILESKKFKRNLSIILILCSFFSISLIFLNNLNIFLLSSYIFLALNALHTPLIQKRVTDGFNDEILGTYNGLKSLGWIVGGLVAGFSYQLYFNLPFILTSLLFILSLIILNMIKD